MVSLPCLIKRVNVPLESFLLDTSQRKLSLRPPNDPVPNWSFPSELVSGVSISSVPSELLLLNCGPLPKASSVKTDVSVPDTAVTPTICDPIVVLCVPVLPIVISVLVAAEVAVTVITLPSLVADILAIVFTNPVTCSAIDSAKLASRKLST